MSYKAKLMILSPRHPHPTSYMLGYYDSRGLYDIRNPINITLRFNEWNSLEEVKICISTYKFYIK